MKNNDKGSVAIVVIVIAVLLLGGGTIAYFVTDGFGSGDKAEQSTTQSGSKDEVADEVADDDEQIPAGFPADMPIFEPAEIITSDDEDGYSLGLQAKDASEEEVMSFYETELAKAGWSVEPNKASSSVLKVSKGDWSGSVTIIESTTTDIGTTISYLLEES